MNCDRRDRKQNIHGGDVYRNSVELDFSVNLNPLGVPDSVMEAMADALENITSYPDIISKDLKEAVGHMLEVPGEYLTFGNGASELFMAIVHGLKPRKVLIPVPSYYGYEYAADAANAEIIFYKIKEETGFGVGADIYEVLTDDIDMLFLANPNNPTGRLIDPDILHRIFDICKQNNITVVLDESFVEFCGPQYSLINMADRYDNLIIVRTFTKIFAIPGVRLGYMICSNLELKLRIERQLPEWNISVIAQAAGRACTEHKEYLDKTPALISAERQYLAEHLEKAGLKIFPGEANYILVYSEIPLYERLLAAGILIRDCSNYRGLVKGYYRIAVRTRQENDRLLKAIGEIINGD